MKHLILSTASSLVSVVRESDLAILLKKQDMEIIFREKIATPFDFDAKNVIAIVPTPYTQKIDSSVISHFPNLKLVIPFGTGTDHIDIASVKSSGVAVSHVPGGNRIAVAELTLGFIFALLRKILIYDRDMKSQKWDRLRGQGLQGKTLGIIGLGHVGKEVAKMALGVGLKVLANDIKYDQNWLRDYPVIKTVGLEELLISSDIISLHVPLDTSTKNMIGEKALSLMKLTAYLINTARGGVIDEEALLNVLKANKIAGVALDVFSEEPPFTNVVLSQLIAHPRTIVSPHAASLTPEAQYAVAKRLIHNIIAVQEQRFKDADIL